MLGFTLSKLNLLILAISASATVAYFLLIYADTSEAQAAQQLAQKIAQDAASLTNSATYCDYLEMPLPNSLAIGEREFYYKIKVSGLSAGAETPKNYLIFSVIRKRRGEESIVAVSSVVSSAELNIFKFKDEQTLEIESAELKSGAVLDPQTLPRQNIIIFVKEIKEGIAKIYVIPCSSENDAISCSANKSAAGEIIYGAGGTFGC